MRWPAGLARMFPLAGQFGRRFALRLRHAMRESPLWSAPRCFGFTAHLSRLPPVDCGRGSVLARERAQRPPVPCGLGLCRREVRQANVGPRGSVRWRSPGSPLRARLRGRGRGLHETVFQRGSVRSGLCLGAWLRERHMRGPERRWQRLPRTDRMQAAAPVPFGQVCSPSCAR